MEGKSLEILDADLLLVFLWRVIDLHLPLCASQSKLQKRVLECCTCEVHTLVFQQVFWKELVFPECCVVRRYRVCVILGLLNVFCLPNL